MKPVGRYRGVLLFFAVITAMMLIPPLLTRAYYGTGSLFATLLSIAPWLVAVAFLGAGIAAARRIGAAPHCAACGYEKFESDRTPARCPECAGDWSSPDGIVLGRRRVNRPLLFASITVGVFAALFVAASFISLSAIAPRVPTGALIRAAERGDAAHAHDAWQELTARQLSEAQAARLASVALRPLAEGEYPPIGSLDWLERTLALGALDPEIGRRYAERSATVTIEAPDRARAGEPFAVGARIRRATTGMTHPPLVLLAGFRLGDESEPRGRIGYPLHPAVGEEMLRRFVPDVQLVIERPGTHTLRLEYWIVLGHPTAGPVAWSQDGTPDLGASVFWYKRYGIEHGIDVVE